MDNKLVRLKFKQRLNKLASSDFTNLECWQEAELINKAQNQWTRRQLYSDERSIIRIDDLQFLLTQKELKGSNRGTYFETVVIPDNYLKFKRLSVKARSHDCDKEKMIKLTLVEEANVDQLLSDYLLKPSFKWGESFFTLIGDKAHVYTNNDFQVIDCNLTYYRNPQMVVFDGCRDWNDEIGVDQPLEFKDSIIEMIIDEAVSVAAADMNDYNNYSRSEKKAQADN